MNQKPILTTQRLTLIPLEQDDLTLLHETLTNPFVRKHLADDKIISGEQAEDFLQTSARHFQQQGWGLWKLIVRADQSYAGLAGLWHFFEEAQPQLLYALLPEKTGQGYATEASQAVMRYAFDQLRFSYLTASCDVPNKASIAVMQRLGMQYCKEEVVDEKPLVFYQIQATDFV